MTTLTVGMVGLGEMGGNMMKRLLLGGHKPYGYNRTKAKVQSLIDAGMQWCDSPRAVMEACDVVISMVTDDKALEAITSGPDGLVAAMKPGKVLVDMSTVGAATIRALDERVRATGGVLIDAAVLGSQLTVEQGKLLIIVGGDEAAIERVRPVLLDIGPKVRRVGEMGHAKVMKVALNLNLPVQILAMSEGVLLAEKSGISREIAVEMMLGGVVCSPMLAYRGPFVLDMPEKAWFDVGMMQKDLNLAIKLGQEVHVPLPATSAANEMLTATRAMGLGSYDFAVLFHTLARMAGLDWSPKKGPSAAP
jgi:3-hydroxyisobutyrate dehydrogenase-like beta-hydroxyacid dehydrogenase